MIINIMYTNTWKTALLLKMQKHTEFFALGFFVHWKPCLSRYFIWDIEMLWKFLMSVELKTSKTHVAQKKFVKSKLPNPSYLTPKKLATPTKLKIDFFGGGRMMVCLRG